VTSFIGASQPFGTAKKLSYTMTAERYEGRVLYVTFRTEVDLTSWLPPPLEAADPFEGFLKIYDLKRWPENGEILPPGFSQYHEVCVTVLAAPPGEPSRHYNLFMWVDRDWALYKAREVFGWPKKLAQIDMTTTHHDDGTRTSPGAKTFAIDMSRWGYQILRVRAELDPDADAQATPPFNGFYTVRHFPGSRPGTDVHELLTIETADGWFQDGEFGEATVEFFDAPDEELSLLGPVTVTGCVLRNVGWLLPGWPARKLAELEDIETNFGDPRPREETT